MDMGYLAIIVGMDMTMGDFLFFQEDSAIGHPADFIRCSVDEIHVVGDKYISNINAFQDIYDLPGGLGIKAGMARVWRDTHS